MNGNVGLARSLVHANLNPVRLFHERNGRDLEGEKKDDGTYICRVELADGSQLSGEGKNKKLAKYDACRKALQKLESN